jgi:hypothetical protein
MLNKCRMPKTNSEYDMLSYYAREWTGDWTPLWDGLRNPIHQVTRHEGCYLILVLVEVHISGDTEC